MKCGPDGRLLGKSWLCMSPLEIRSRITQKWRDDRLQRRFERQRSRWYWIARSKQKKLSFSLIRGEFSLRNTTRNSKKTISALSEFFRLISRQFLLALLVIVIVEILDRKLEVPWLTELWGDYVRRALQSLSRTGEAYRFDRSSATTTLATYAQIAGVFLGLYFASVSLVVNVYASTGAPESVRELLVQAFSENGYIAVLTFYGASSLLLLIGATLGLQPALANIFIATILCIASVIGFVILGLRAFILLSPTNLASRIPADLYRTILSATSSGPRWADSSVQLYNRKLATTQLGRFTDIQRYSESSVHWSPDGYATLAENALSIIQAYAEQKSRIPTESQWFERTRRHRSWLTANSMEVSTLAAIGLPMDADETLNPLWLERGLFGIIESSLSHLLEKEGWDPASAILRKSLETFWTMGRCFGIQEAIELQRMLTTVIHNSIHGRINGASTSGQPLENFLTFLGMNEATYIGPIQTIIGLTRAVESMTIQSFEKRFNSIDWDQSKSLYESRSPRTVIKVLEDLAPKLLFEQEIEGKISTPPWYIKQAIARGWIASLEVSITTLITEYTEFTTSSRAPDSGNLMVVAIQKVERGFEQASKLSFLIHRAEQTSRELEKLRTIADEAWPNVNWEKMQNSVKAARQNLVRTLALCAPQTFAIVRDPSGTIPDFAGYALRVLTEETANSLEERDHELFKELFRSLFVTAFAGYSRLQEELADANPIKRRLFLSEPFADLLQLSGLAMIYSEATGLDFLSQVKDSWAAYFRIKEDPKSVASFIASVVDYRSNFWGLPPYQENRDHWQRTLEKWLQKEGLLNDEPDYFTRRRHPTSNALVHTSPLLRALVFGGEQLSCTPLDVFVVLYLGRIQGIPEKVMSLRQRWFREQLSRAESGTLVEEEEV